MTPFGAREADPARGTLLGNRGCLDVAVDGAALLLSDGALRPWSRAGYGPPRPVPGHAEVLTPRTSVRALAAGWPLAPHASLRGSSR